MGRFNFHGCRGEQKYGLGVGHWPGSQDSWILFLALGGEWYLVVRAEEAGTQDSWVLFPALSGAWYLHCKVSPGFELRPNPPSVYTQIVLTQGQRTPQE